MFGGIGGKKIVEIILKGKDETGPIWTSAKKNVGEFLKSNIAVAGMLAAVGAAAVKMGLLLRREFRESVIAATEFEKAVAEINTLLGESPEVVAELTARLQELAVQFGQTDTIMARAQYNIVSAGFNDIAESTHLLEVSSKAAIGGITDVNTAARLITQTLNAYGLGASDAEEISGILFATIKGGVTTFPELAQHMGKVTATAATAGISFGEVAAAMAAMTKNGIQTSEAATSLNSLLVAIGAASGESKDLLDAMGITLENGLAPALEAVDAAGGDSLRALKELIPNIRALKAAASVGADGAKALKDQLEEAKSGVDDFNQAYEIMAATVAQETARAEAATAKLRDSIGRRGLAGELDYLKKKTDALNDTADAIDEYGQHIETLAYVWGNVKGAMVGMLAQAARGSIVFTEHISLQHAVAKSNAVYAERLKEAKDETIDYNTALKEFNETLGINKDLSTGAMSIAEQEAEAYKARQEKFAQFRKERDAWVAEQNQLGLEESATAMGVETIKLSIAEDGELIYVDKTPEELAADIMAAFQEKLDQAQDEAPLVLHPTVAADLEGAEAYADELERMALAGEDFADTLMDVKTDPWPNPETQASMDAYIKRQEQIKEINKEMSKSFQRMATTSVRAFLDGTMSAKNFANMLYTVVIDAINAVIARLIAMLALKAFSGIPFLSQGGTVKKMAQGGSIPRAAQGYTVPLVGQPGMDSVPIIAQPGEHVFDNSLSRKMTQFLQAQEYATTISPFGVNVGGGSGETHLHFDIGRPVSRLDAIDVGEHAVAAAAIVKEAEL